jgi:VWFA-related protein
MLPSGAWFFGLEDLMFISRRVGVLLAVVLCWIPAASGQQVQLASQQPANSVYLDVVVASKSGAHVGGLAQQDFTLLDNGVAQAISSFRAVGRSEAPAEVVIVVDAVNAKAETVAYERTQIDKVLRANGGLLPHPTTFAVFTEVGTQFHPDVTTDGNALAAAFSDGTIRLRTLNQGESKSDCGQGDCTDAGFEIASERRQLSLKALESVVAHEAARPGRKLVLWISPGWPLLSSPSANSRFTSLQRQQTFGRIVSLSTQIQQARVTLYSIDPLAIRGVDVRDFSYQAYLKGVRNIEEVQPGNLGLQVLAVHSGGLALSTGNDLAELLQKCFADTETYYEISFEPSAASAPDEYHRLEIRLAKPGMKARTRESYYAQLSSATNNPSLTSPSQAQVGENEP